MAGKAMDKKRLRQSAECTLSELTSFLGDKPTDIRAWISAGLLPIKRKSQRSYIFDTKTVNEFAEFREAFMTRDQLASFLDVSLSTVTKWVKIGRLSTDKRLPGCFDRKMAEAIFVNGKAAIKFEMTAAEAGRLTGMSEETMNDWARNGRLPANGTDPNFLFSKEAVEAYLAKAPEILNIKEVATLMGETPNIIQHWVRIGILLPVGKPNYGNGILFDRDTVDDFFVFRKTFMTPGEASRHLKTPAPILARWSRTGILPSIVIDPRWRLYDTEQVKALADTLKTEKAK